MIQFLFVALVSLSKSTHHLAFNQRSSVKSSFSTSHLVLKTSNVKLIEQTPLPITPTPDSYPNKFYVCEGDSCKTCENDNDDDSTGIEFQLTNFTLLDETLTNSELNDIEIIICGSTRQNHPALKAKSIYEKQLKFQGFEGNQFISINMISDDHEVSVIDIASDNVTIVVNELEGSQDFVLDYAELKNSPIEINNLTILDGDSDLTSLSSVRNTLYTASLRIFDSTIPKVKMGIDSITLFTTNQNTKSVTLYEYDISMDIRLFLNQDRLDFTADSNVQKEGTENNVFAVFENEQDKTATVVFDSSWNTLQEISFIQIKHNCDLEIISDKKEIAKSIEVYGDGKVTRNGKIDGDDDDDSSSGHSSDENEEDHINQDADKKSHSILAIACFVAVAVILVAAGVFMIVRKKCRRRGNQNFNDYLNNADDLGDMDTPM